MPLCFVIGQIGKDGSNERKHANLLLNAVIKHVLENKEFGYLVKRSDEDADPGMIGDRVITDIIRAELVVADLTDLNPNAFYELGIRHSAGKPTIHMAKLPTILPFDNVAHRTIFVDLTDWASIEQARAQLAASVRAIAAPGYKVSNPITQANASFEMRESDDPRDQVIAEMLERMAAIESGMALSQDRAQSGTHHGGPLDAGEFARILALKGSAHANHYLRSRGYTIGAAVRLIDAVIEGNGSGAYMAYREGTGASVLEARAFADQAIEEFAARVQPAP